MLNENLNNIAMNSDLRDARILIVDDQLSNIELLQGFLILKEYQNIRVTQDPREVFAIVSEFKPDLILLDLMMPYLSGSDVMRQLNIEGLLADGLIKILVLTADANVEIKIKALSLGASDFLTKPLDLLEVDLRIKNLLLNVYLLSQLNNYNLELEEKVNARTIALKNVNEELILAKKNVELNLEELKAQNNILKDIAWIQSHVVRAPLARMMGAISLLEIQYADKINHTEINGIVLSSAHELDEIIRAISEKTYKARVFENVASVV